ncbi:calcyclin-binding protein-like [Zingiber officinale]|uniref:calcyclin-binding protein-like n=1 Tax=Zingiber officinale TaxID=94328 RepID=UPI001C4AED3E|nr:calcyclin-binding protein-like [Zingiber officinale]
MAFSQWLRYNQTSFPFPRFLRIRESIGAPAIVALSDLYTMAEERQLRLDLKELSIAKRPRVVSFLAFEIRVLDAKRQHKRPQSQRKRRLLMLVVSSYVTLGSFSWDQDNDKIKIYISIEGADQEKVDAVFKPVSVDLKLHDINGQNYQFSIPKLNKEISPDQCKLVVKPTKVIVTLVKTSRGNWLDLHF